jgi:hypothetical protein
VAHQFAFCVYIAARVLLVSWRHGYLEAELPGDFWALVRALEEFSARWRGCGGGSSITRETTGCQSDDLAAKYSQKLRGLHANCLRDGRLKVNVSAYTAEIEHSTPASTADLDAEPLDDPYQVQAAQPQRAAVDWSMYGAHGVLSPLSMGERHHAILAGFSPETSALAGPGAMPPRGGAEILHLGTEHSLGSISQTLLDQQFGEMDRIIGFEDGPMFAATMDIGGGW